MERALPPKTTARKGGRLNRRFAENSPISTLFISFSVELCILEKMKAPPFVTGLALLRATQRLLAKFMFSLRKLTPDVNIVRLSV